MGLRSVKNKLFRKAQGLVGSKNGHEDDKETKTLDLTMQLPLQGLAEKLPQESWEASRVKRTLMNPKTAFPKNVRVKAEVPFEPETELTPLEALVSTGRFRQGKQGWERENIAPDPCASM